MEVVISLCKVPTLSVRSLSNSLKGYLLFRSITVSVGFLSLEDRGQVEVMCGVTVITTESGVGDCGWSHYLDPTHLNRRLSDLRTESGHRGPLTRQKDPAFTLRLHRVSTSRLSTAQSPESNVPSCVLAPRFLSDFGGFGCYPRSDPDPSSQGGTSGGLSRARGAPLPLYLPLPHSLRGPVTPKSEVETHIPTNSGTWFRDRNLSVDPSRSVEDNPNGRRRDGSRPNYGYGSGGLVENVSPTW